MEGVGRLSIVVPVLDEAPILGGFLEHLRARAPGAEIIVVDGGSRDGSPGIAARGADVAIAAPRGRPAQMNAGARAAAGELFWFLHADSRLPEGAAAAIRDAMSDARAAGGCFRLRIPRPEPVFRISDVLGNVGVDLFRIALGDHGIFCRRSAFEAAGGFPDVPLLEDAELYRRLRRTGRVRQLPLELETSPRRYERNGPGKTTALYALILALYLAGVSPAALARLHARLR